jgi:peptide/nickel transport system permease protein
MVSFLGLSMPNFWIAMLLILIFSVKLKLLPTGGYGTFWHLLMPAFSLGWYFSAGYTRITYSSLLQVLNAEFIKMARIKGLSEFAVVGKQLAAMAGATDRILPPLPTRSWVRMAGPGDVA